jgi:hypothetical protein
MGNAVRYGARSTVSNSSVGSGSGGGDVEDVLKRLGNVETHVSELRSQVSAVLAIIPHLATKADVADVRTGVGQVQADLTTGIGGVKADLGTRIGGVQADLATRIGGVQADLATRIGGVQADLATGIGGVQADLATGIGGVQANLATAIGGVRADLAAVETAIIKWIVATVLTSAALAFTIAKFVH